MNHGALGFHASSALWTSVSPFCPVRGPRLSEGLSALSSMGKGAPASPYQGVVEWGDVHPAVPLGQLLCPQIGFIPDLKRKRSKPLESDCCRVCLSICFWGSPVKMALQREPTPANFSNGFIVSNSLLSRRVVGDTGDQEQTLPTLWQPTAPTPCPVLREGGRTEEQKLSLPTWSPPI